MHCTVLIVEDNELFRCVLREALHARFPSITVLEAEDLAEAEAKLRTGAPDLVLLDLSLPDGNGLDFVEVIRRELPAATVAVCTSYDLPEYREVARARGAAHFVCKQSIDWDEVGSLVDAACRRGGSGPRPEDPGATAQEPRR